MSSTVVQATVRNWKTTTLGITAAIVLIGQQLIAFLDSDPATVFSWESFFTGGIMALIGVFAKDGNKSTEDVEK